jgi:hypothetical protein
LAGGTVNKDFEIKNEPIYHSSHLRGRIDLAIKRLRDEGDESKEPVGKIAPVIPVTGRGSGGNKYANNKSVEHF